MKLLSWNVAGRTGVMDRQSEGVERREPDLVCLQEVRASTAPRVETCEALFAELARTATRHRILCGDLNTPRYESEEGETETFASNHPFDEGRWDAAERSLLVGLAEWDLPDVFRALNGYGRRDVSWVFHTRARRKAAHRLDHVLASAALRAIHCDYVHEWREAGLSDHSAMEVIFEP